MADPTNTAPRIAFMFSTDDGDDPAIEAPTLAAALACDPRLSADRLHAVWCLDSMNRIWGDEDGAPWKDVTNG